MNLLFGFAQSSLYYPLLLFFLYIYLVILVPLRSTINITNIFVTLIEYVRVK
uniref:Uncharacterized protein n=1 Tax=Megaceros flagellaris TaxID=263821 RepID=A0A8F2XUJ8_9EMBR|nr:hypothetical protein [Megaceros flagellaris]